MTLKTRITKLEAITPPALETFLLSLGPTVLEGIGDCLRAFHEVVRTRLQEGALTGELIFDPPLELREHFARLNRLTGLRGIRPGQDWLKLLEKGAYWH